MNATKRNTARALWHAHNRPYVCAARSQGRYACLRTRCAPTEVGTYKGVAVLTDRLGSAQSQPITFECAPSASRGFVRVCSGDRRYLAFDDGTPFFAIGQNVAFVYNSYATIEKVRKLGGNGANFARVWACAEDWAMAIEARKSAWGRSWAWNPPIVAMPDRGGFHSSKLCLKLDGEAGARITLSPSHPVSLRPNTRYRLTGNLRADGGAGIEFDLGGRRVTSGMPQWTKFTEEFTTAADQWWLPEVAFRLTAKGSAWLRDLSVQEAGGGPELLWEADVNRPILGVYNQTDCFMLDQIVEAAEQSGVYLQVVLLTRDHYMPLLGKENAPQYEQATRFAKQLARYAAARWGYSTSIAVWEYFNEMNPGLPTDRFYTEVGEAMEKHDLNRHLRATSAWGAPAKDYRHPKLETVDMHHYLRPANGELWKDEVATVLARWQFMQQHAKDKPIFFSEFGITDNNWQRAPELDKDAQFVHLHNALWASMLSGFAGTVSHWYWDDVHKRDAYRLYQPISGFAEGIPWTGGQLRAASATCDKGVRAIGLQTDAAAYLWLHDPQATWWNIAVAGQRPAEVKGASLSVENLGPGDYGIEWWDTRQGAVILRDNVKAAGGRMSIPVPAFTCDIACKVIRGGGR